MSEAIKETEIGPVDNFTLIALHIINQEGMSIDISKLVPNFRIFESIYNKFLTADVTVVDGINLLKHFRFTGQEYCRISYKAGEEGDEFPHPTIDRTFRVYQAVNVTRLKETEQAYQLKLCDPAMFTARSKRLQRVFRGSHSNMLELVIKNDLSIPNTEIQHWEDSEHNNHQFVCPNWTVTKFIDYICNHANKGTSSLYRNGFFFFQTMLGGYVFKSIDNMVDGTDHSELTRDLKVAFKPQSGAGDEPTRERILSINKPQLFDTLTGQYGGAYSSQMFTYDPIRKLQSADYYNVEETFDRNSNHVSKVPLIRTERMLEHSGGQERGLTSAEPSTDGSDQVDSPPVKDLPYFTQLPPNADWNTNVVFTSYSKHDFDNSDKYDSDDVFRGQSVKDNSRLERTGMLQLLQQQIVNITIPIRSDLTVGQVITLEVPEPEILDDGSTTEDSINDNRYLITDLAIDADPSEAKGFMNIECVKESYAKDISLDIIQRMNKSGSSSVNEDKQ